MSNVIRRCTTSQLRTSGIDPDMYIGQVSRGVIWDTPGFGLVYGLVRSDRRDGSPLFRFTSTDFIPVCPFPKNHCWNPIYEHC